MQQNSLNENSYQMVASSCVLTGMLNKLIELFNVERGKDVCAVKVFAISILLFVNGRPEGTVKIWDD